MSGRAKFVHWLVSPFSDIPSEPMFNVVENDKGLANGSTIGGGTLLTQYGISLPIFPDLQTWKRQTEAKRKCFRCWATVKGATDLLHHREVVHHERFRHTPNGHRIGFAVALILMVAFSTGCDGVRHLLGQDRNDAKVVNVPIVTSIIRQLPPAPGNISFYPDRIGDNDAKLRVFVKTGFWLTASPGGWYEIPWAVDVDTRTTEYAVVSLMAQSAIVYNQPNASPRAIIVESIPLNATYDPGIPPR